MGGFEFLFAAALWALPLAGLPVLLHMLFRRKSPVIPFSTLRFISASLQQTAARRRVQRWLLLVCRVLLLLLLILAIAQPVRILATGWMDGGSSTVAAVVIDTSYSMLLKQQEMTLLDRAGDAVLDLLRGPLKDAKVAVFRSMPAPADRPEAVRPASQWLAEWTRLAPQPAPRPLADRCAAAVAFLRRQPATARWLIILTDVQSREFVTPLASADDARVVFFDLHPDQPGSNGITALDFEPRQPIPGIGATAVVEVAGRSGDAAFVTLDLTRLNGESLKALPNQQANLSDAGRSRLRIPLPQGVPAERWLLASAQLQREDNLDWDNRRTHLMELPPRQTVAFADAPTQPAASQFLRLALDPWEGRMPAWPLQVRRADNPQAGDQALFLPLTAWPDSQRAAALLSFVRSGGTLVLLLQPGLEETWPQLSQSRKNALLRLLPAAVAAPSATAGIHRVAAPARPDPLLENLGDPEFRINDLAIRRFVPFAAPMESDVACLLYLTAASGNGASSANPGLLYRRPVGAGRVFTFTSLPDARYLNPPVHPLLLPLMVNLALRPPEQRGAQNVDLGQNLILSGGHLAGLASLEITAPGGERYLVQPADANGARTFTFDKTTAPGLYVWRKPNEPEPVAIANVQVPVAEADLVYRDPSQVVRPSPNCLIVRSFAELQSHMTQLSEPQPRWTWLLVLVLLLICLEAMLASLSHLWRPPAPRTAQPRPAEAHAS